MPQKYQECFKCNEHTGKTNEDELRDRYGNGPYCGDCWDAEALYLEGRFKRAQDEYDWMDGKADSCHCHGNPPCSYCMATCHCGKQRDSDGYCENCDQYEYYNFNPGEGIMNLSTSILLVDESVRGIECTFDSDGDAKFTYKSCDKDIKVGDLVIVPTKGTTDTLERTSHVTSARVTAVDVDFQMDSAVMYKWIIQRIDAQAYKENLEREKGLIQQVNHLIKAKKRRELQEEFKASMGEDYIKLVDFVAPATATTIDMSKEAKDA